jgi:molecular chaperone GrpE
MHKPEDNREQRTPAAPIPIRVTDRRPRFDGPFPAENPPDETPARRLPSYVAELEVRTRTAEAKLADALDLLRRREAEAEEFRARLRREMEKRLRAQVDGFLAEFLEVLDSLDRGVALAAGEANPASLLEGLVKVRDQLVTSLARQGVEPMSVLGAEYDPHLAEAVAISPAGIEEEDNKVLEEIRRGFLLEGRVLRPAQVRVARRAAPVPQEDFPEPRITES